MRSVRGRNPDGDEKGMPMTAVAPLPQLYMTRPDLTNLPPLRVAEGYCVRTYEPGDDVHWVNIIAGSFKIEPSTLSFDKIMRQDPAFRPERIFFVCHGVEPVGTTAAYLRPVFRPQAGMIHYVGVLEGHGGKGLGQALMGAALNRMRDEEWVSAWLSTDDHRLAAIKIYLALGFEPWLLHESHRSRWPAVLLALNRGDLIETWQDLFASPIDIKQSIK